MKLKVAENLSLPADAVTQTFGFLGRKGSGKTYAAGSFTHTTHAERRRPANGQKSLLPDIETFWRCRACGRQLRNARSIARGLGANCARKEREADEDKDATADRKAPDESVSTRGPHGD